jgi:hypothetical protein
MKLNVYSIYDTAAAAYMRPFFMPSDGQATRAFTDLATQADHEIGKHPEDYFLCRLAVFDDGKGSFADEDNETLITGLEAVAASRNNLKRGLGAADDDSYGGTD